MISFGFRRFVNVDRLPLLVNIKLRHHHPRYKIIYQIVCGISPPPCRIMEVGVNHGAGAYAIIEASKKAGAIKVVYYGFDLFFCEEVKKMLEAKATKIQLFEGDSRRLLSRVVKGLPKMDFIYIDGGHSYDVVNSDWENARLLMHHHTVVLFDDYIYYKGVRKVVNQIDRAFYVVQFFPYCYLEFWSFPRRPRYVYDCMAKVKMSLANKDADFKSDR